MKPKGKKLPKWAIPVGIAAAVAIFIVLRKKPAKGKATEPGAEGLTNQSFIPVTSENVSGAGASYYPTTPANNENLLVNFLKEQNEESAATRKEQQVENRESIERERNFFETILSNLGTGGGAPTAGGPAGVTVAPAPEAATPPTPQPVVAPTPAPTPAPPAPPKAKCPSDFPDWNPANGAPAPHSCYKYSRERCNNKAYPYKHVYQDGHVVCSPV
jgi:hypothetical protein